MLLERKWGLHTRDVPSPLILEDLKGKKERGSERERQRQRQHQYRHQHQLLALSALKGLSA